VPGPRHAPDRRPNHWRFRPHGVHGRELRDSLRPTAPGFLTLYFGAGGAPPSTSTINFYAGQTRANNAVVPLNPNDTLAVWCGMLSGQADFIIDVNGYFQ
jgi:hypothetical protein